jgi:hypothetical protein
MGDRFSALQLFDEKVLLRLAMGSPTGFYQVAEAIGDSCLKVLLASVLMK